MKKRIMSLLMVVALVIAAVPGTSLTAYAADTYTVSFNGNQGSGQMNSVTATFGQAMPKVNPAFSRTGYSFAGFYDAANGGTQYYNNSGQSTRDWDKTANTTLYAHWTASKYTVTLNQQGGTAGSGSTTATYAAAMPIITPPQKTGYTFQGYFTEANGKGTKYYNANGTGAKNWDKTAATTLYAYWTAKTYTVTLSDGDGTGGSGTLTATYDANLPTAAIPTKSNYAFAGYYDQENGAGTQYINDQGQGCKTWDKDGNTTLYAHYISTVDKTALNTAITEAETLYNSIKDEAAYSEIASTLNTAIGAAKDVAESDEVDQDAVDAAATAITDAKTNTEAAKKDVDDTSAANAVSDIIAALPAKDAITKDNKTAVDAAKAAFDALTDDQKKKVSEADKQKLNDAIAAIEKDEEDAETAKAVSDKIAALPAKDTITKDDKTAVDAAKAAFDALTDDQKKKVSDEDKQKLNDAIAAIEAIEKDEKDTVAANKVADTLSKLPAADKVTTDDKAAVEAERKAYDALTDDQKAKVPAEALKKLEDAEKAIAAAEKKAAEEKAAAEKKAAEEKAAAEKKAAEEKAAAEKKAAEEKAAAEKKAAEEKVAAEKKAAEEKAAAEKKAAEEKAAAEKKAAKEKAAKKFAAAKKEAQTAMNSEIVVTQKGKKITVKWNKAKAADGYDVYVQYCGKKFKKPVKTIKKNSTTKVNITKINGKKINLKKQFKLYVEAYKKVNGKKVILARSNVGHVVGIKNTKYTNVKSLKVAKKAYTVKVGKKKKIKATVTLVNKNKKHIPKGHGEKFRYRLSDTSIATVSKNGTVTGKKKGTCTIYVYAINGKMSKTKITVK